ncbi:ATP-dependent DNA ligase [Cohnella lupini]|uniref:DNA ligase (ATP) n=1 Tax=Cohnella lupini TaxID=1294267 RepID=A0A3D9IVF2_9BACL|nr:ATP-dependent DNA ligase [Cohnella lupini]RED65096.1 bifunctional non-homologous end joining protein LigD [Cohnella lupini]
MEFKPVVPFEPIRTERMPKDGNWVAQVKWDGVRMLSYYNGADVQLINRRLNKRSLQYPEFLSAQEYCSAKSFILDGEFIAFDENKPSFHEIMRRDSLRQRQSIEDSVSGIPVTYMIFDVLFFNGDWVVSKSLSERQMILNDIILPSNKAQIVENYKDSDRLLELMKSHNMEGIVLKNLDSSYLINGKDRRWQKRKLFHDLFAVIGGFTYRDGIINSLLLGIYSNNSLVYIGHAGTGKLTHADWIELTRNMKPSIISYCPFENKPGRFKGAVWVKPMVVVKVQFMEWTASKTMRHPSIQSINVSMAASDCTFEQNQ